MDLQEILSQVIRSTNEIFQAEAGSVALLEPWGTELVVKAAVGVGAHMVQGMKLPVSRGIMGWVATHAQPALVSDAAQDERFNPHVDQKTGVHTQSVMCVPLTIRQQTIGVIELINMSQRYLSDDGLKILATIADHAALAIDNAWLVTKTRQHAEEQALLFETMALHTSDLSLDTVLDAVSRQMIETLAADACTISRWDRTTGQIYILQRYSNATPGLSTGFERIVSPSATQMEVLTSQVSQFVRVKDARLSAAEKQWVARYGIQSVFVVPLVYRRQTIGLVEIGRSHPTGAIHPNELRLAETMAMQAAVAIEHARLYNEATRHLARTKILQEVMLAAASSLDFDQVLSGAITALHRTLGVEKLGFFLTAPNKKEMRAHPTTIGYLPGSTELNVPIAGSAVGWVQRSGQPLLLPDTKKSKRFKYHAANTRSEVSVPVVRQGQVVAVLNAQSPQPNTFGPEELRLFSTIAAQLSIVLENSRLFEEMRAAEASYRDLFDNAYDLIFTLDNHFRVTSANKMALQATGYQLHEAIGMHATQFIHPRQTPELFSLLKTQLSITGIPSTFQLVILTKTGQEMVLEVTMRIRRAGSRATSLHFIARDITRRHELELRLRRHEKLSTIGQLVAGVAHELNNPLTSIIGYASLLQQSDLPQPYRQDLEIIFRQAERASLIVKDLLTFARNIELETAPTNLNQTISSSLRLMTPELKKFKIQVTTELDPELPQTMADRHQLEQVFVNLLTNSIQALDGIRGPRRINISTNHQNGAILITLSDNGPGVPELILPRIFDPFFSTKQVGQGTGLGLSICFGIISEHKGRIWAERNQPQGVTFFVELPVQPVPPAKTAPAAAPAPFVSKSNPPSLKILVVDDEEFLLTLLQSLLSRMGHRPETISNGSQALQLLESHTFDLVICDMLMPDLNGPQLYRQVVARYPELADCFIFITGNAVDADTRAFLDETGAPWLDKPFLPAELAHILVKFSHQKQMSLT